MINSFWMPFSDAHPDTKSRAFSLLVGEQGGSLERAHLVPIITGIIVIRKKHTLFQDIELSYISRNRHHTPRSQLSSKLEQFSGQIWYAHG